MKDIRLGCYFIFCLEVLKTFFVFLFPCQIAAYEILSNVMYPVWLTKCEILLSSLSFQYLSFIWVMIVKPTVSSRKLEDLPLFFTVNTTFF